MTDDVISNAEAVRLYDENLRRLRGQPGPADQKLDIHYEGRTGDGNRLRLTAFRCKPPLKTDPVNMGTEEKPLWLTFVCGHTAWHDERGDDDDTDACYPYDPAFDDD